MKTKILISICLFLATIYTTKAQVKIGDNPNTINANSLLELESTTKGFLAPRVAINDLNSYSPLSSSIPVGMLVYSVGGSVTNGFYNWDGSKWVKLTSSSDYIYTVTKTVSSSLIKTDAFVLASNDITLTLPAITSADNGLAITIKNIGTYTDLVTVVGNGAAIIDNGSNYFLTRWQSQTYVAYEGNWLIKDRTPRACNILDVSPKGSWETIEEAVAFLNEHMIMPAVIRIAEETQEISNTIDIDLPYPLTIQGESFGSSIIEATSDLDGLPMFVCHSECYFKMLTFTAYANTSGNDGIHFVGSEIYSEVKDSYFYGFNKGIVTTNNTELWIFEADFDEHTGVGIEVDADTASDGSLKVSECDFTQCKKGINLKSGVNETISIINCTFYNTVSGTDIGINYEPSYFTSFASMFITNNAWNNEGSFTSGFDFSLSTGRDANAFLISNAGMEDKKPYCKINVNNNAWTTTLANNAYWYHANFLNSTGSTSCKWKLEDNKITYLPSNGSGAWAVITGNISVNYANRVITIAICKNGSTLVRYGETDLRITTANQPFQFSTVIYVPDLVKNDYLEIAVRSANNGDVVLFQDVQWYTNAK